MQYAKGPAYIQNELFGYPGPTFLKSIPWWIGEIFYSTASINGRNSHKLREKVMTFLAAGAPRQQERKNLNSVA